ncbi:MAG: RNA polymerase sigma factor [Bacteroidales bacterium]|nr:RNA polymerase sigma factor [Bacteroidales bacterium]
MFKLNNIVKACLKGDSRAQAQLYEQYGSRLYAVCLRYTNNEDDAKDILQEGFIKIFDKLHQYKNKGSLEGWMRKIIVNTALERTRRENRFVLVDDETIIENDQYKYDHVLEEIGRKELLEMIQELSAQYRMVFNLYAIEGYSHKEISKKLDIQEGTSKSNLSRARELLKSKIEKRYKIKLSKVI